MGNRGPSEVDAVTAQPARDRYRWVALSNTTLGVAMAQINSSIVLISLPACSELIVAAVRSLSRS